MDIIIFLILTDGHKYLDIYTYHNILCVRSLDYTFKKTLPMFCFIN